jgi:hypothetical protein
MKKFLIILFILPSLLAFAQKGVPDDFCLTEDEYRLYELINAHRLVQGEREIPLSASLSFVARTHVIDLFTNHPDTGICNLNSWSDKGDWTACCHNKYIPKEECIRNKPKELTSYTGEGYELTYAEILSTSADTVFRFWKKIDEANEFLLNRGRWEEKTWRAMGVGMYKSYAVVWMGQRTDGMPRPEVCEGIEPEKPTEADVTGENEIRVISRPTNRFYVIIASFQSEKDARREAEKHTASPGTHITILKNSQGQFRVSINDYQNLEDAKAGKENYKNTFSGAWILNY